MTKIKDVDKSQAYLVIFDEEGNDSLVFSLKAETINLNIPQSEVRMTMGGMIQSASREPITLVIPQTDKYGQSNLHQETIGRKRLYSKLNDEPCGPQFGEFIKFLETKRAFQKREKKRIASIIKR